MTHKEKRNRMDEAIKKIVIPFLRDKKFKGSYPHFRREDNEKLNLLTFQFSLYSPKFVVEISNCPIEGIRTLYGEDIKPSQCRVNSMGNRLRIGSIKNKTDYWYNFDKPINNGNIFETKAQEVVMNWDEAEDWWKNNPSE